MNGNVIIIRGMGMYIIKYFIKELLFIKIWFLKLLKFQLYNRVAKILIIPSWIKNSNFNR